jgi:hypothetical protein
MVFSSIRFIFIAPYQLLNKTIYPGILEEIAALHYRKECMAG